MRSPSSQDTAVSPAIGTILLVALTVVFIAVAAVVAMGLAGGIFDMKHVGLTLEPYSIDSESERGISLTVHGGADAADLVSLSVSLNGPELVYQDGNSSVENPLIGKDYRFKAVESNVIVETKREGLNVQLETTEVLPVNATEYYVTVTGTFRDGTEQVLLIQKVTLPAIAGKGSASDAEGSISVSSYSISDKYPGHGFIITVLDPVKYELVLDSAEFFVPSKNKVLKKDNRGLTPSKDSASSASYDINTVAGDSEKGWDSTPYPDPTTYWALGELTGDVTVYVKDKTGQSTEVTVSGIVIPERVNIFEDTSKYAGEITYNKNTSKIGYTPTVGGSGKVLYYLLPSKTEVTTLDPDAPPNDPTLEAYVKVRVNPTEVWYRVGSAKVNDLLRQT